MKKIIVCLLLVTALLAACGQQDSLQDSAITIPNRPTEPITTEPDITEPATAEPETTQPVTTEPTIESDRQLAPDFTVYDPTGKPVKLSDLRGKPVVLNFWASWCGPCKGEMPDFQKLYEELGDQVQFVMVNLSTAWGDTKADAENLLKTQGFSFPVYYDTDGVLTQLYGITGIPATLFVDENGGVATGWSGMLTEELIRQGIDMIL